MSDTKAVLPIGSGAINPAEEKRNVHHVVLDERISYEAIFQPAVWAHVVNKLHIGDRIEIVPEDGSYLAEVLVRDVGPVSASVAELYRVEFDEAPSLVEGSDLEPLFSRSLKWTVRRKSDGARLADNLATKQDALRWIAENTKG